MYHLGVRPKLKVIWKNGIPYVREVIRFLFDGQEDRSKRARLQHGPFDDAHHASHFMLARAAWIQNVLGPASADPERRANIPPFTFDGIEAEPPSRPPPSWNA